MRKKYLKIKLIFISMIPRIFHFFDTDKDFLYYKYFCIHSVIEIEKPLFVYFHAYNEPDGYLWNMLKNENKDKIIFKKIDIPNYDKIKKIIIFLNLLKYGGVFLDIYSIFINPLLNLYNLNYLQTKNESFIMCIPDSPIIKKKINNIYKYGLNNLLNNFNDSNYILLNDNKYYFNENKNEELFFQENNNYTFSDYFHIVNNCYFYHYSESILKTTGINNHSINDIFTKTTIYNLLVRYILSYNNYFNNNEINNDKINNDKINNDKINNQINVIKDKVKFINNIDCIIWINMDSSTDRRDNMNKILNNFDPIHLRYSAIDGGKEEDICHKYFYSENNIYPSNSNKEYAILLSHLNCIEKFCYIKHKEYNIGLICEDDLSLDFMKYWDKDIAEIISGAPNDWEIIMLGYFYIHLDIPETYNKWNNQWSAIAYLVNGTVEKKIKSMKKDNKWICNENDIMVSDNYIFSKLNTYFYKYPYFTFPNENDSTFHDDHIQYHKIYKLMNYITHEKICEKYMIANTP